MSLAMMSHVRPQTCDPRKEELVRWVSSLFNLRAVKDTVRKTKSHRSRENIRKTHVSDKGLVSKIYKELLELNDNENK